MMLLKKRLLVLMLVAAVGTASDFLNCQNASAQCGGNTVSQPITVDDETSNNPGSRQLVNGTGSTIDTSTPGQIKVNVSGGGSGVSSVNPGTETTIGGTSSAPTVNVQFAINSTLTASTSLAVGTIYPCNTSSGGFTVTLPDATSAGNKGAHIVVFLKTAGNTLSVATTSSQLINGQSAPISVTSANTFLLFIADGTNWQCVPLQPATGQTSNQWVSYIDSLGAQHTAQISFSNLSGSASAAQMLSLPSGQIYVGNGSNQPAATTPSAGTGLSVSAGAGSLQYSLSTPVSIANGGTNSSTTPTNGQLLIGNSGGGYSVAYLTAGSNVTITNSSGGISIASTGSGGGMTSLPSGQIYVGNSSSVATATTPTAGTGLSVSAGSGSLQYSLSTPVSIANGGTSSSTAPTSGQLLIGTSGGGYTPATLTAGSNITVTNSSGGITIAASGGSGGGFTYSSKSSSFSASVANCYEVTATSTCTLPTAVGNSGAEIIVWYNAASGTLTFNTTSSQTMSGIASGSLTTSTRYDVFRLISNGSNWIIE